MPFPPTEYVYPLLHAILSQCHSNEEFIGEYIARNIVYVFLPIAALSGLVVAATRMYYRLVMKPVNEEELYARWQNFLEGYNSEAD